MKKFLVIGIMVFVLLSCFGDKDPEEIEDPVDPIDGIFIAGPGFSLELDEDRVRYTWTHSDPFADRYDVYWMMGEHSIGILLTGGANIISNAHRTGLISNTVLGAEETLSAMVVAVKKDHADSYSPARRINSSGAIDPPDPPDPPDPVFNYAPKRGVGYNFTTLRRNANRNHVDMTSTLYTSTDMDLLMGGKNGISWFYGWGITPNSTVASAARDRDLEFVPMFWNAGNDGTVSSLRTFYQANPLTKYVMGYNEPNFPEEANLTPLQAANAWPRIRNIANELGLKIISPAMNFGSMMGPIQWLDEFRGHIGETAWAEIDAINVHVYPWWPSAVKSILDSYRKYEKKIWLTEFCGWEDIQSRTPSPELQAWYLGMTVVYLEMDPMIERYAWYLPKGHVSSTAPPFFNPSNQNLTGSSTNPYHNLITEVSTAGPTPELTDLGIIYTNIPTFVDREWEPVSEKIDASQFTNCNLAPHIGVIDSWSNFVQFRVVTDTDKSAGVLEIFEFRNNMWVEYQIDVPQTRNYTLTLRYNAYMASTINISVDGVNAASVSLEQNSEWATKGDITVPLTAGKRTVRLTVTGGFSNCALNWLQFN